MCELGGDAHPHFVLSGSGRTVRLDQVSRMLELGLIQPNGDALVNGATQTYCAAEGGSQ